MYLYIELALSNIAINDAGTCFGSLFPNNKISYDLVQ